MHGFVGAEDRPAPVSGHVFVLGVLAADESSFLRAAPAFQLLFARDGFVDVGERFDVKKAVAVVLVGEA